MAVLEERPLLHWKYAGKSGISESYLSSGPPSGLAGTDAGPAISSGSGNGSQNPQSKADSFCSDGPGGAAMPGMRGIERAAVSGLSIAKTTVSFVSVNLFKEEFCDGPSERNPGT